MTILIIFLVFILMILFLTLLAFLIICRWNIFKKAGKEGWEAAIPFYSSWTYFEISGYPGWISLITILELIPFMNFIVLLGIIVINIIVNISLSRKFNKKDSFGVLLALLPIIGLPMLAFGNDKYDSKLGDHYNIKNKSN